MTLSKSEVIVRKESTTLWRKNLPNVSFRRCTPGNGRLRVLFQLTVPLSQAYIPVVQLWESKEGGWEHGCPSRGRLDAGHSPHRGQLWVSGPEGQLDVQTWRTFDCYQRSATWTLDPVTWIKLKLVSFSCQWLPQWKCFLSNLSGTSLLERSEPKGTCWSRPSSQSSIRDLRASARDFCEEVGYCLCLFCNITAG